MRYWRTTNFSQRRVRMLNRRPLISFTFDDFPRSALFTGGAILRKHGAGATYYASLGLMDSDGPVGRIFSEQDLHLVLEQGHELGCHTFDHCHSWATAPTVYEDSIRRNREALNKLIPGAAFSTFSYPRSIPRPQIKKRAQNYFSGCRGGGYAPINIEVTDLNLLNAFFLEKSRGDVTVPKSLIAENCRRGGWLIFATHDVDEKPTQFGCTPAYFAEIVRAAAVSGAAILPVGAALKEVIGPNPDAANKYAGNV